MIFSRKAPESLPPQPPSQPDPHGDEAGKRAAGAKQLSAAFGAIVALFMRSAEEKFLSLQDLEWLVLPALIRGQFVIAEARPKESGAIMPVGVVLWALVSPEVDKRLAGQKSGTLRLAPDEWRSGDVPWIIVSAGDRKVVGKLLEQLTGTVFKERPPRMRVRDAEGKVLVGRIEIRAEPKVTA
jgi:cytolysin-activating lysine-acyltransferase